MSDPVPVRSALAAVAVGHALAFVALLLAAITIVLAPAVGSVAAIPTPGPSAGRLWGASPPPDVPGVVVVLAAAAPPATAIPEPTAEPSETPEPSPTPLPLRGVDAGGGGARLRSEPGLRAAIVGALPERAQVALLGPEAEEDGRAWRRVRSPDGVEGWVHADLLAPIGGPSTERATPADPRIPPATATPDAAAEPNPTPRAAPAPLALGSVDAGGAGARLREAPSLGARTAAILVERATVALLGPEADADGHLWRRIRGPDGAEGWVDATLLAAPGAPARPRDGPADPRVPPAAATPEAPRTPSFVAGAE